MANVIIILRLSYQQAIGLIDSQKNKKFSYRRGTAQRAMSVEIMSTAA